MIYREKMICSILLLITLTSCVSGSLVVDVTQSSYQAEESFNVILEWTFTPRTDGSLSSFFIFCEMFSLVRSFPLFDLYEGVEVSKSQHRRFAGRVQFDKDVLREGRLRLHMSRLRTDDSGYYTCRVNTGYGGGSKTCHLKVTADMDPPQHKIPNLPSGGRDSSQPVSPGWTNYVLLLISGTLYGVFIGRGLSFLLRKLTTEKHQRIARLIYFLFGLFSSYFILFSLYFYFSRRK